MWVYRVENKDGEGPYRGPTNDWFNWQTRSHNHLPTAPSEDLPTGRGWICGFKDKAQLNRWFTKKELLNLRKIGYRVKRISAAKVRRGKYQVVFVRTPKASQ